MFPRFMRAKIHSRESEALMRKAVLSVLLLATLPVLGAPAPFSKPERSQRSGDLAQLQGEWEAVEMSAEKGGMERLRQGFMKVGCTGTRWRIRWDMDPRVDEWEMELTIDPRQRPKHITLRLVWVQKGGEQRVHAKTGIGSYTEFGVYHLEGDRLTICAGFERPKRLGPSQGRDEALVVYKRTKR
jgi:uncharacterized protein (TIGR03067 family)